MLRRTKASRPSPGSADARARAGSIFPVGKKVVDLLQGRGDRAAGPDGEGRRARADKHRRGSALTHGVDPAAQPARFVVALRIQPRRVPDRQRAEVRAIGIGIAHTGDDRQPARLQEPPGLAHSRVQSQRTVELDQIVRRQAEHAPMAGVASIGEGDDHVDPIIPSVKLDDDQHAALAIRPSRSRPRRWDQKAGDRRRAGRSATNRGESSSQKGTARVHGSLRNAGIKDTITRQAICPSGLARMMATAHGLPPVPRLREPPESRQFGRASRVPARRPRPGLRRSGGPARGRSECHVRRARPSASNALGPADCSSRDDGRRIVGPADEAAGRKPCAATRPPADVRRVEQVLAQLCDPFAHDQRARGWVERARTLAATRRPSQPGPAHANASWHDPRMPAT